MNDLATLNGKGQTITADGREYRCLPLTLDDHGDLQAWIDTQQLDPFEVVSHQIESRAIPIEVQKFLYRSALELSTRNRVLIGSPEANALLDSAAGEREILYLSIRKGDPTFTRAQAAEVYTQLREAARLKALGAADVMRGEADDPKAPTNGG